MIEAGVGIAFCVFLFLMGMCAGVCIGMSIRFSRMEAEYESQVAHLVNDCRIDNALTDFERTKIKEVRLINKGYKKCERCYRVSGMYYTTPAGLAGITLVNVKTPKGDALLCSDCAIAVQAPAPELPGEEDDRHDNAG